MSKPQLGKPRIVIVGGGAGGLELATRLGDKYGRKGKLDVTLIERKRTHVWKPKLHEIAAGSMDTAAHEVDYLAPAFAGEALVTTTFIANWNAASSERRTRIARASDDKELVRAVTTWAFVSTETGRPRRIPPAVVEAFALPPRA